MPRYTRRATYNVDARITVEISHDGTLTPDELDDRVAEVARELLGSSGLTLWAGNDWAQIEADIDGVAPEAEADFDDDGNPVDLDALDTGKE